MNKKGFTLIELLVVIAIISLLSSIALASFDGVREKARDAKRLSIMRGYVTALELIRDDIGGYPTTPNPWWTSGAYCLGDYTGLSACLHDFYATQQNAAFDALLEPYMSGLPPIEPTGGLINGAAYVCEVINAGRCRQYRVLWAVEKVGAGACGFGQVQYFGNNEPTYTMCFYQGGI